jgi:hypothetical protein
MLRDGSTTIVALSTRQYGAVRLTVWKFRCRCRREETHLGFW